MKVLANCLKPLIPQLILEGQGGFFEKRHIVDNIVLIQEEIHSSVTRKEQVITIKLDMANSF